MTTLKLDTVFNTYDPFSGEYYATQYDRPNKSTLGAVRFEGLPEKMVYPRGLDPFPMKTNAMNRKDASSKFTRDGIPLHPSEAVSIAPEFIQPRNEYLAFEGDSQEEKNHPDSFVLLSNTYLRNQMDAYPDGLIKNRPDHSEQRRKVALDKYRDMMAQADQIPDGEMKNSVKSSAKLLLMEEDPELYSSYALQELSGKMENQIRQSETQIDEYKNQSLLMDKYFTEMEKDRKLLQKYLSSQTKPSSGGQTPEVQGATPIVRYSLTRGIREIGFDTEQDEDEEEEEEEADQDEKNEKDEKESDAEKEAFDRETFNQRLENVVDKDIMENALKTVKKIGTAYETIYNLSLGSILDSIENGEMFPLLFTPTYSFTKGLYNESKTDGDLKMVLEKIQLLMQAQILEEYVEPNNMRELLYQMSTDKSLEKAYTYKQTKKKVQEFLEKNKIISFVTANTS